MDRLMRPNVARSLRLAFIWALVAGLVVAGSPARACSCVEMDVAMRLPEADGAFVGTLVQREGISNQRAVFTFDVERVIKGRFGRTAIVRTNASGASCSIELLDGPRDGFLLDRTSDGMWESDLCSQVSPDELLAFSPGETPDPAVAPIGPGAGLPWWVLALAGAI